MMRTTNAVLQGEAPTATSKHEALMHVFFGGQPVVLQFNHTFNFHKSFVITLSQCCEIQWALQPKR